MRKYSSIFWKSAELPTACDKHNCNVTNNVAAINKLLFGNISKTFAAVDMPYWWAASIVVTTDNVHVAGKNELKIGKNRNVFKFTFSFNSHFHSINSDKVVLKVTQFTS